MFDNILMFYAFFFTVKYLKLKWKHLKDTFITHKRNYEKQRRSGSGKCSEPAWKWWPVMRFLDAAESSHG